MTVLAQHDELAAQRRGHPAWRLLASDNVPLVLGFLDRVFLTPNVRRMAQPDLLEKLDDHLYALRRVDAEAYPRSPEAYLADWADPRTGWLRKSYPAGSDVPEYEPTPAVETAAGFVRQLGHREFLGTASRLLVVRDLLRQITAGAAGDPEVRLAPLYRQRAELDAQIEAIQSGADAELDDTAVRERYDQAVTTARDLLADLRQVEENFRAVDRDVRGRATTWTGPRGEFLESVFGSTDEIGASDQGRSWRAFWEHMLNPRQQEELAELFAAVAGLPALRGDGGTVEKLLRDDLLTAADATQRVVASLSGQLRRFLDERTWDEGRRVHEVIRAALSAALAVRNLETRALGSRLPGTRADIALPLERPLHTPASAGRLNSHATEDHAPGEGDLEELFDSTTIDLTMLRAAVADAVTRHGGIASLAQVVAAHPLTDGLAELVGYLTVSDDTGSVHTDSSEPVDWIDPDGRHRQALVPLVLFGDDGAPEPRVPVTADPASYPQVSADEELS